MIPLAIILGVCVLSNCLWIEASWIFYFCPALFMLLVRECIDKRTKRVILQSLLDTFNQVHEQEQPNEQMNERTNDQDRERNGELGKAGAESSE